MSKGALGYTWVQQFPYGSMFSELRRLFMNWCTQVHLVYPELGAVEGAQLSSRAARNAFKRALCRTGAELLALRCARHWLAPSWPSLLAQLGAKPAKSLEKSRDCDGLSIRSAPNATAAARVGGQPPPARRPGD